MFRSWGCLNSHSSVSLLCHKHPIHFLKFLALSKFMPCTYNLSFHIRLLKSIGILHWNCPCSVMDNLISKVLFILSISATQTHRYFLLIINTANCQHNELSVAFYMPSTSNLGWHWKQHLAFVAKCLSNIPQTNSFGANSVHVVNSG